MYHLVTALRFFCVVFSRPQELQGFPSASVAVDEEEEEAIEALSTDERPHKTVTIQGRWDYRPFKMPEQQRDPLVQYHHSSIHASLCSVDPFMYMHTQRDLINHVF